MSPSILNALTGFVPQLLPEILLSLAACVLFLGATFQVNRHTWGFVALAALACAGVLLWHTSNTIPTLDDLRAASASLTPEQIQAIDAQLYNAPVVFTRLALFFKGLGLLTGVLLVLLGWDEGGDEHAGEYHACLLLLVAGVGLVGAANDLMTLFLALELISLPTYVLLYLPRADERSQEATMKYFLLSIFSSGLLLFGFSYLYGLAGTTNIPAMLDALATGQDAAASRLPWLGVSLLAVVLVVAGLGFRITAVPFHFYAPDVYQGTTTPAAALLAFVPKIVGFAALLRVLGYAPGLSAFDRPAASAMGEQVPMLLWIMAAVTMSLGNVLALLQDNIRRMIAYSSVAHAGYMLIGLAVVRYLSNGPGDAVGGVEALLFYLVAYGAMTVGFFAALHYLDSAERPIETVDDLAGLGKSHPGSALLLTLFLFSLIGMPLTAGFAGKFLLFFDALGLPHQAGDQARLYRILALIAALNAAVGAWYYLRMVGVMYLREAIDPLPRPKAAPVVGTVALCAALTLGLGVYPEALLRLIRRAVPQRVGVVQAAQADRAVARE
ncbi:MAG: NADH-quinone oxidoreductase subunit N [Gemmataceae bacterium]